MTLTFNHGPRTQTVTARDVRVEMLSRRLNVLARDSGRSAKALLRDAAGNYLLLRALDGWDLPGGHLQDGEAVEQGLSREVREETGLEVSSASFRQEAGHADVFDATVAGVKPKVKLSDEHQAYKWVGEAEAHRDAAYWLNAPQTGLAAPRHNFQPTDWGNSVSTVPTPYNRFSAHDAVRDAAQVEVQRAVDRVVALAEAEALAKKKDDEAFLGYAAAIFLLAIAKAYGEAAPKLGTLARGEDRGDVATQAEEEAFAQERADLLRNFAEQTKERLEREVEQAKGESRREVSARVAAAGDELKAGAGKRVAETEAQSVYGAVQLRALKRAGYTTCFWVTQGDERVRDSHRRCEAAGAVKVGSKFPNGLRYPGDPSGGPEEVMNCRCWLEGGSKK